MKKAFSRLSLHPRQDVTRFAFTLAEVLITLGIIGIVAALTMPALTASYRKHVVVTRLKKFYSVFSQAVKLIEADYGDMASFPAVGATTDNNNPAPLIPWWQDYMAPYINTTGTDTKNGWFLVRFNDGSGVGMKNVGTDLSLYLYFCVDYNKCLRDDFIVPPSSGGLADGRNIFAFNFNRSGFYAMGHGQEREALMNDPINGCTQGDAIRGHRYCAALIQYDGWEIAPDYPVGF